MPDALRAELAFWKANGTAGPASGKSGGGVNIPPEGRLDVWRNNTDPVSAQNMTVVTRAGNVLTVLMNGPFTGAFDGRIFSSATLPSDSSLFFAVVPRDTCFTWSLLGTPTQQPRGYTSVIDQVSAAGSVPTLVANGTAETALYSGANVIGVGVRVYYALAATGINTTLTDKAAYIAIKGHTSGIYYVVALGGTSQNGYFDLVGTTEKLDLVYANADTVDHSVAGNYIAVSP